ncbi:MAG: chromosome segregation protein SMC [Lachnospiraceae bacterium]|nr:chromosome segregation protein SMC [Lachnospiraceae bacterium]
MYLKSIEVQGFKSFANKIVFKFHNGITGIVGPNGSGKSNVADAVRWVLGEQRVKQLRGGSMQDVIFSGTEIRKALSSAYVAITLDNSDHQLAIDYDEVTVSRRLYRSGESEYMINGTICRLKDVAELFYDTGIGKEGYSIIGQGQIDRILSGKPEERRELFDEAAGIVKFKRRKNQAVKKLEDEKMNLVRVNDILSELEKQLAPLEKQAEKARTYLKKKESLKTLDVNVFLLENVSVNDDLQSTIEKLDLARNELNRITNEYEKSKSEFEEVENRMTALDEEIEATRKALSENSITRTKLENQIELFKEQIKSAEGSEEHFNKRIADIKANIAEKEKEKESVLAQKAAIDEKLRTLSEARDKANEDLTKVQEEITGLNDTIEENKNLIIESLDHKATIKSQLSSLDTRIEQINIQKADVNAKLLKFESEDMRSSEEIVALEKEFTRIGESIEESKQAQKQAEEELVSIRETMRSLDDDLQKARMAYQQEKSKLDALINIAERYEGYGGAIKAVMEQKTKEKGLIGVVADILSADEEYETAIETALGGNIQNIVTDDEDCAKRMIAYLKQNRHGRATFLPLTSINNPEEFKKKEALEEKGVIGLADTLVHVDKKYKDVASYLLGRILVVDNIDNAVKIARKYKYSIRMVTKEGEYLTPGGAISGGAFKNTSNLLSRRREIESIRKHIDELKAKADKIEKQIESKKSDRNALREKIEDLKMEISDKTVEQNTARLNVESAREKQGQARVDFEELNTSKQDLDKQGSDITQQKEDIRRELVESEDKEKKAKELIDELTSKLENLRETETAKLSEASNAEVEVEKVRQSVKFYQTDIDRIDGEIAHAGEELDEVQSGVSTSKEDIEAKKNMITELEKTIEASITALAESETKLSESIAQKEELTARHKEYIDGRENLYESRSGLEKEVYRLENRQERLESALEDKKNYMWDEYEITLSDAAQLKDPELTDLPDMKKQISGLKDEIRKLGDVNVNAIEDYREVSERYGFMKTQHDDLVTAEQTLKGIIDELDTQMRDQFTKKFGEINRQFDKVFKELFGGGTGTLELMEDEDILEAGIRITAQPPGKKLVNMMQMSGGEKSLTAIALLFAIQNLKPSPFCLLDEIEAALDESNVSRFADYLHKLTRNTQFIVITHRRGTMEKADRLYGITMQEKGVSTLVSVSLIDKELDD